MSIKTVTCVQQQKEKSNLAFLFDNMIELWSALALLCYSSAFWCLGATSTYVSPITIWDRVLRGMPIFIPLALCGWVASRVATKGAQFWAPVYWVRAKLPKILYPESQSEKLTLRACVLKELTERAKDCAGEWQQEALVQSEILTAKAEICALNQAKVPQEVSDIVRLRQEGYAAQNKLWTLERNLEKRKKYSSRAAKAFYRAWEVFSLLDMLPPSLGSPKDFLNEIKKKEGVN